MKRLVSIAALSAALAMGSSAHAENLVTNGEFTDLTNGVGQIDGYTQAVGWDGGNGYNMVFAKADTPTPGQGGHVTLWDDTMASAASSNTWDGEAAHGGNFLALDGDPGHNIPVTQAVGGLVVGQTYDLTFSYAFAQQAGFNGDTAQWLTASMTNGANTDLGFTTPTTEVVSHGFSGWTDVSEQFTATSTEDLLSFLADSSAGSPPYALISNISLSLSAAPEPAVWALMFVGLGGVGLAARRRRRAAATAA